MFVLHKSNKRLNSASHTNQHRSMHGHILGTSNIQFRLLSFIALLRIYSNNTRSCVWDCGTGGYAHASVCAVARSTDQQLKRTTSFMYRKYVGLAFLLAWICFNPNCSCGFNSTNTHTHTRVMKHSQHASNILFDSFYAAILNFYLYLFVSMEKPPNKIS